MDKYEIMAEEFAKKHGITMDVKFLKYDYYKNFNDNERRNIYSITVKRNDKKYKFTFGQSIVDTQNNKPPTMYNVLTCLTKYPVGSYEDFLADFGYEKNKHSSLIYKKVKKEYAEVDYLFNDIIDDLRDIQ